MDANLIRGSLSQQLDFHNVSKLAVFAAVDDEVHRAIEYNQEMRDCN